MHSILIDSDVILDLFIDREPHHSVALRFFSYLDLNTDSITGYTSPVALANVAYILTKVQSQRYAVGKIRALRKILHVATIDSPIVDAAIANPGKDFEDALQYQCAIANELAVIVTRNTKHYPHEPLSIARPQELIAMDIQEKSTFRST
jgi:predicted nucleic acid-binding protein